MSSAVADLEAGLQAMLTLKPPGVSGSRITSITQLCTDNVQSESVLIQKLYTHFKKAPGSHKLGVLYVVDSVTRKWTEQAKLAGQPINSAAQDGTFAAGVHRVKELLPVLMTDIVQTSPNDQKEKIRKLIDIWEKGQTFPLQMLTNFKEKLDAQAKNESTTPPGSPPSDVQMNLGLHPSAPRAAPVPSNTSTILEALANMARQNTAAAPTINAHSQVKDSQYSISNAQSNPAQPAAMNIQPLPIPFPVPPSVNVPAPAATFASHSQGPSNGVLPSFTSNQTIPNPFGPVPPIVPPAALDPAMQQQLMLIKALSDQGVPADKIAGVLTSMGIQALPLMGAAAAGGFPPLSLAPPFAMQTQSQNQNQAANAQNGWGARSTEESRDHNGYHDGVDVRSPPDRYRRRSRSRSPQWNARDARDSPSSRRREGQGYDYDRGSPAHNRLGGEERGRGRGHDYRQRSPPRRRSPSPPPPHSSNGGLSKWVDYDASIPKGSIKVLSRTLFVGGVTSGEPDLRSIFSRYGKVQTCIVNKEKRHAFVKMISRADAITAKEAMEKNRTPDSQLRTRWGVGFGPRDCSDYTTGVSIIPISKLTDADRKWMLTAEYGGSGGKPIDSGMVVEEPDIEIGQGVSSKAISRRMQTDKSGNNGPKSTREREDEDRSRRGNNRDEYRDDQRGKVHKSRLDRIPNVSGPPSMPPIPPFGMSGFPFTMPTLPNGMPMLPPGFVFPGGQAQSPSQPPPPGRST